VTFASLTSLGTAAAPQVAARAQQLGYTSFWTAETTGPEAFALLGAAGGAAPGIGLGTGVLALQLRTPMVVAMAGATLQALHPGDAADGGRGRRRRAPELSPRVTRPVVGRPCPRRGCRDDLRVRARRRLRARARHRCRSA